MVAVSAWAHRLSPVHLDDPNFERRPYDDWMGYAQSKTANILFALGLNRRGGRDGISDFSLHPGAIITTDLAPWATEADRRLAQDTFRPGSAAPPMYPVLGGLGIPEPWQQAVADGRLDGKAMFTGTARNEMASFFALDPRIQAVIADQARALVAGQVDGGAERFNRAAARQPNATPAEVLTALDTEILFRDGTLAIADRHAAAGHPTYVYQFDYTPPQDPAHLAAAHCVELPFFFDTIDA